ncbi:hypothetical protein BRDID11002_72720 [Bradyrhizobium diazoefficiens]
MAGASIAEPISVDYDRGDELETHAYALIHTDNIKTRLTELFGADMQFDVVIGNPPYQLGQSGGEAIGSFAMPIYQKFVEAAKAIETTLSLHGHSVAVVRRWARSRRF